MDPNLRQRVIDLGLKTGMSRQQANNLAGLAVLSLFDGDDLWLLEEQFRLHWPDPDLGLALRHRVLSGRFAYDVSTTREIADALDMHQDSILRTIYDGRLEARKAGGIWLVTWSDLVKALDEGQMRPRVRLDGEE